jgi:D-cysteine desulfhydrase
MTEPALFTVLPRAREVIPWMPLGRFPTRATRIDGLLPRSVELWVKREDECGDPYGGNKVRKLEFLLGEARARGHRTLVTFGGWGAHHVVATCVYGARHGFAVEVTLFPQPDNAHVREQLQLMRASGAAQTLRDSVLGVLPTYLATRIRPEATWLAGGGSSPTGTLGWVSGGLEIREQIRLGELPPIDVFYGALGSCGTMAGLAWSLRAPRAIDMMAVRVVDSRFCGEARTVSLMRAVDRRLAPLARDAQWGEAPHLHVDARFRGRYGEPTPASQAAVVQAARVGLTLEPIYTGKVMAALLADARAGRLNGKRVLFLHSHDRGLERR